MVLKFLQIYFAVRGHDLKKWLFFRFAEGVRPYKPPFRPSTKLRDCVRLRVLPYGRIKAADPEKQTLLRLDPLLPTSN